MKITVKNFQKKIPVYPKRIKKTILEVLSREGLKKSVEITICFVNDKIIRDLNRRFHRSDSPTDVLAFDVSDPKKRNCLYADIVVSAETALRNAKIYKTSTSHELNLYAIHGTLHILGYNDLTKKQALLMRRKEKQYVNT